MSFTRCSQPKSPPHVQQGFMERPASSKKAWSHHRIPLALHKFPFPFALLLATRATGTPSSFPPRAFQSPEQDPHPGLLCFRESSGDKARARGVLSAFLTRAAAAEGVEEEQGVLRLHARTPTQHRHSHDSRISLPRTVESSGASPALLLVGPDSPHSPVTPTGCRVTIPSVSQLPRMRGWGSGESRGVAPPLSPSLSPASELFPLKCRPFRHSWGGFRLTSSAGGVGSVF